MANKLANGAKRFSCMILQQKAKGPWGCRFNPFTSYSSCQSRLPSYADPQSASKLLKSYLKLGEIDNAEKLFDEITHRDIAIWSIMIHGYAKNGLYKECVELFSSMRVSGLTPNSFTMVGVLGGVAGLHDLVLAECVHGVIVNCGLESHSFVATAMLDAYAKCGSISLCCKVFKQMDHPGLVSCNALLAGLVQNELFEEAVQMFIEFRRNSLVPSSSTTLSLIQCCIACNSWDLCKTLHAMVIKLCLHLDVHVSNSVLNMYSSLRKLDAAQKVFGEMECKDALVPSWAI